MLQAQPQTAIGDIPPLPARQQPPTMDRETVAAKSEGVQTKREVQTAFVESATSEKMILKFFMETENIR